MGSVVMMYIPCFMKIGSGIKNAVKWDTQKSREDGDRISLLPVKPLSGAYSASNRNEYQKQKNNVSGHTHQVRV
jgi:hypothetical protein